MILFKRVGESFRHIEGREWALLTLETLGVLAGILIAFELQEWGQRRSEAAKHHHLMERLFEESQFDVITLRDQRDIMRSNIRTEIAFATKLSEGECPAQPLWKALSTINRYPAFQAPRSVYQELMGAGGLSSIEHERVRYAIAQFNSDLDWVVSQNDYFRSRRGEPIPDEDPRKHQRYNPIADDPLVESFDRQALCRDHGFRNRMMTAVRNHRVMVSYHDGITDDAIYMCGVIGESLGRRCRPKRGGDLVGEDAKTLQQAIADEKKSVD
jgi:hypothetical protein